MPTTTSKLMSSRRSKAATAAIPSSRGKAIRLTHKGLQFERVFSNPDVAPFDEIAWEQRTAEIADDSGKAIFKQENIEVPASWSPLATKIAVSKYFYGDVAKGTDPYKGGRERSVKQLIHRVTRTIADWGMKDGYFADKDSADTFYNELTWLCVNQFGAFNSPVWFNCGLYQQYGTGAGRGEGNYFINRETKIAQRAAPSAIQAATSSAMRAGRSTMSQTSQSTGRRGR